MSASFAFLQYTISYLISADLNGKAKKAIFSKKIFSSFFPGWIKTSTKNKRSKAPKTILWADIRKSEKEWERLSKRELKSERVREQVSNWERKIKGKRVEERVWVRTRERKRERLSSKVLESVASNIQHEQQLQVLTSDWTTVSLTMTSPSNGLWTSDSLPETSEVGRHEIASPEDAEDVVQVEDGAQAGARGPAEDELLRGHPVLGEQLEPIL